jgi:serine-type D-Ala-D-Ala carboxypeptidase (penicillin-binding protein 5/6)
MSVFAVMFNFLKLFVAGALVAGFLPVLEAQVASSYAVSDQGTGYILDAYKADEKRPIASLTKVATAKVVLDWAAKTSTDLSRLVTVPVAAMDTGGINPMGLQPNDAISFRDLIYAALLQSDNTAALTLASQVGAALQPQGPQESRGLQPVEAFVSQMNALARELGMERTLFVNPHGLEPRKGLQPYSCAQDLTRLTAYAMKDPGFRFYVSQKERKVSFRRGSQVLWYLLRNTNQLLGTNRIDGVKTGRTAKAGDCVIISAQRDAEIRKEGETTYVTARRINLVVLGAADRFAAANQLLPRAWELYDQWAAAGRPTQLAPR